MLAERCCCSAVHPCFSVRSPSLMTCNLRCLARCCSSSLIKVEVQHGTVAECLFCCTRKSFDKAVLVGKSLKLHCSQAISTLLCNSTLQWCQTARQLYIGAKINGMQSATALVNKKELWWFHISSKWWYEWKVHELVHHVEVKGTKHVGDITIDLDILSLGSLGWCFFFKHYQEHWLLCKTRMGTYADCTLRRRW